MKNQNPHNARVRSILFLLLSLWLPFATAAAELNVPYGSNVAAGTYASVNGIKLYYESYGSGQPMLQIHFNGGSISTLKHQIAYFSPHYKVIVADSRGHGKSEMGAGRLTLEQIADDLNALRLRR